LTPARPPAATDDYEPKDEDLGDEFEAYFGWCSKAVTGPKIASKVCRIFATRLPIVAFGFPGGHGW
jgi:hypothetical protein